MRRLLSTGTHFREPDLVASPATLLCCFRQFKPSPRRLLRQQLLWCQPSLFGPMPLPPLPSRLPLRWRVSREWTAGPSLGSTATAPHRPSQLWHPRHRRRWRLKRRVRRGSKSRATGRSGTPLKSDEGMDVGSFLSAIQRKERPPMSKPTERPQNPIPEYQPRKTTHGHAHTHCSLS